MKTRALSLLTVLIVLSLLLSACGAAPQSGEPIKVGGIFDLTGATADVGVPYADGLKGYVDWINAKGGIKGRKIELIGNDYAYKVPNAEQLYSQYRLLTRPTWSSWPTHPTTF